MAVLDANGLKPTERDIVQALESRLAKFKLPKRVIAVDSLPRNTMGKVQKKALAKPMPRYTARLYLITSRKKTSARAITSFQH